MRESKTIKQELSNSVIDHETGEVLKERKKVKYSIPSEPDFVKVYLKDLLYLVGLPKFQAGVVYWMMQNCNYADTNFGMCVVINSMVKETIMSAIGIKNIKVIDNCLTALTKKKIVERLGRGTYRLNPYLFGRGDWTDILNIRMTVEYNLQGKSISTEIKGGKNVAEKFSLLNHLKSASEQLAKEEEKAQNAG